MTDSANNPIYIVTGASSGIGKALTEMLLDGGSRVIGISRTIASSAFAADKNLVREPMDFTDINATAAAIERLKRDTNRLDGIFCCAGMGRFGALEQFSDHQVMQQINTNLIAHILLCKAFVPLLKRQNAGLLIFIGSDAALRGAQQGSIYCASKFGLRGFAQALRQECARSQVRVSIINPGMLDTPFYDDLHFKPGTARENTIDVATICKTVQHILTSPAHAVFDEINISPLKHVVEKKPPNPDSL